MKLEGLRTRDSSTLLETQLDGAQRMPRAHPVPQEATRTRPRTVSEDEARVFMQRKIAQRRSSRLALREQYDDTFVKECPFSPNAASDALQRLVNFTDGRVAEARAKAHERHLWETAHEATDWDHFLERNKAFLEQKEAVLELKRQNKELEELDGCTFRPDVGEAKRSRAPDVFCSLYREGLERRELREQMQADHEAWKATLEKEECSFHPQIEPLRQDPAMSSRREITGKRSKPRSYAQLHASQPFLANDTSGKDDSDTGCKISADPVPGAAEFEKVAKSIERLNRVLAASPLVSGRRNPSR